MLKELSIRNFAIIDDLKISFSDGLTILSGETGAGKSIILNAVNLLLGSRASADLVRTGTKAAELEALFHISPTSSVARSMSEQGYDPEDGLLIRRVISRSDSNRVYINGRLATIGILNAITENLASISGQHAHQGLLKEDQHLLIIDQFGGLIAQRQQVFDLYHQILPLIDELKDLNDIRHRQAEQMALLQFQKDEITAAGIVTGEDSELEQERLRLKNAEMLYGLVDGSIEELYGASGSVVERLLEVKKNLERAGQIETRLKTTAAGLAESAYQIEDLIEQLRSYLKLIQMDEGRLEAVEERLDMLNKLKRKYGGSLAAVLSTLETIERELSDVENISEKIAAAETKLSGLHRRCAELALQLSQKRKQAAENLAAKVSRELASLKMAQTVFDASVQLIPWNEKSDAHLKVENQTLTETGIDRAVFMIAPNIGEELKPLASIASGGELSRVILALKAILAETDSVETVVFDEVDAGIGGGTAEVVGRKLSELGKHHQIICITHLPQIAKFGRHHFSISKHVADGRTHTAIRPLSKEDRYQEIARMLGGEEITRTTLKHARELLEK
ncbi:MAG: DNA repair protein RecN [Desulfobacterales bacterium]|nr:MAG: DNA repair protein RecN [Desulfobacterales bacterium]